MAVRVLHSIMKWDTFLFICDWCECFRRGYNHWLQPICLPKHFYEDEADLQRENMIKGVTFSRDGMASTGMRAADKKRSVKNITFGLDQVFLYS